jgi:hypothetical protein
MYLRRCYRAKDGKRHAYWTLVQSVRTARGPRQRVVAYLGEMDDQGRMEVREAAQPRSQDGQAKLFEASPAQPRWVQVDVENVGVVNCRSFGGAWLGLEILRKLGLVSLLEKLMPAGREEVPGTMMALVLGLCRPCEPSSVLHSAEHFFEHGHISDRLGIPPEKVNDHRLFRALHQLRPHNA